MRQTKLFTKTRREDPADEVAKNAKLLIRAGYIHKEMAGVYSFLPLGLRVLEKIKNKAEKSSVAFSSTNFTLVHFDLNKNNILYSKKDGAPIIIDWEQASAGDGAMDIAKLFLKSGFDADQKSDFLKTYESHQVDDQSHFQERLKAYEPFVLINSIIWRLGVLRDMPQQMTSDKTNFDKEIKTLKDFVLE